MRLRVLLAVASRRRRAHRDGDDRARAARRAAADAELTLKNVRRRRDRSVKLRQRTSRSPVDVRASVRRLQPGFHGLHVHAVGSCASRRSPPRAAI
ncbi:MAG TPA: superoxide dismutase family protein [Solirubrobacteraceae bacterium]|nr:superoxide dismutase family protein [Solirubrobacteraceae bacterium]